MHDNGVVKFASPTGGKGDSTMNSTTFTIGIAIVLVAVAVVLVMWLLRNMATASEKRMMRMLQRVGLDPAIASSGDTESIMKEIRQRCGKCQSESVCERWLAGEEKGENEFCPNAQVFEYLKEAGKPTA
jgi:hypothetical protein